jgi:hypothetical protein
MTITITDCSTHRGIGYAELQDVYGDVAYCDPYGDYQVPPGNEGYLLDTLLSVEAAGYEPGEFTITSDGSNDFCLSATPPSSGGGSGGIYSL